MSMYRCSRCGGLKDNDYNVCTEDPREPLGLMCEECACEVEDEKETRAEEIRASHDDWLASLPRERK